MSEKTCVWTLDDDMDGDGVWETQCAHAFQFNDGGPRENGFRFCGYCGGRIEVVVNGVDEPLPAPTEAGR